MDDFLELAPCDAVVVEVTPWGDRLILRTEDGRVFIYKENPNLTLGEQVDE